MSSCCCERSIDIPDLAPKFAIGFEHNLVASGQFNLCVFFASKCYTLHCSIRIGLATVRYKCTKDDRHSIQVNRDETKSVHKINHFVSFVIRDIFNCNHPTAFVFFITVFFLPCEIKLPILCRKLLSTQSKNKFPSRRTR